MAKHRVGQGALKTPEKLNMTAVMVTAMNLKQWDSDLEQDGTVVFIHIWMLTSTSRSPFTQNVHMHEIIPAKTDYTTEILINTFWLN